METLHLVGLTDEGDGLVLSPAAGGAGPTFVVALDDALLSAIIAAGLVVEVDEDDEGDGTVDGVRRDGASRDDRALDGRATGRPGAVGGGRGRRPPAGAAAGADTADEGIVVPAASKVPSSSLGPRELQDRLRAGWSVEEVAAAAGVATSWVERFAVPVLAEQGRIVEQAIALHFDKPRVGVSSAPLVDAVRRNIAERGVQLFDEDYDRGWSAHQLGAGWWAVRFRYRSRGRRQEAVWRFDPGTGELRSENRLAHQLGHVSRRGRSPRLTPPARTAPQPRRAATPTAKPKVAPTSATVAAKPATVAPKPTKVAAKPAKAASKPTKVTPTPASTGKPEKVQPKPAAVPPKAAKGAPPPASDAVPPMNGANGSNGRRSTAANGSSRPARRATNGHGAPRPAVR